MGPDVEIGKRFELRRPRSASRCNQSKTFDTKVFLSKTVQPVLSKHLRENQNVLALDKCLLNTGLFR